MVNIQQCDELPEHYDKHPRNFYNLDIKTIDQKSHKKIKNKEKERQVLELVLVTCQKS